MNDKHHEPISFAQGYELLKEELATGSPPIPENPTALPLGSIKTATSVLQPRSFGGAEQALSTDHVDKLIEAIYNEESKHLDPMVVWWSGKCWRVLDGHHRLEAYQRVHKDGRANLGLIPVTVFQGTQKEALKESARLNSKDKLPMSKMDKLNRAWQMVALEAFTKKEIYTSCKVSNGVVGRMREELAALKEESPKLWKNIANSHTWGEILNRGADPYETKSDEWMKKMAENWAKRLGKTFGTKFAERTQIAAMALEIYSEHLVHDLQDYWKYDDSCDDIESEF